MKTLLKSALSSATLLMSLLVLEEAQAAQVKDVMFESNGQQLMGHLYLPDDYATNQPLPGVVVTGSWTSVKEQMVG